MFIAGSVINMAHSCGSAVVAEGVETSRQLNLLKFPGCDPAQGFYLREPEVHEEWLDTQAVQQHHA